MQKIIFDEGVPKDLIACFEPRFSVVRAQDLNLHQALNVSTLKNGLLLQAAVERGFDAMLTLDKTMDIEHPLNKDALKGVDVMQAPLPVFVLGSVRQRLDDYIEQIERRVIPLLESGKLENRFYEVRHGHDGRSKSKS